MGEPCKPSDNDSIKLYCPADETAWNLGASGEKQVIAILYKHLQVSPVLASFFQFDTLETRQRRIDIPDVLADTMRIAKSYMDMRSLMTEIDAKEESTFTATIPTNQALLVRYCAEKYQIDGLKVCATNRLKQVLPELSDWQLFEVYKCAVGFGDFALLGSKWRAEMFTRLRTTLGHKIDSTRFFHLLEKLTSIDEKLIVGELPRFFSVWVEEIVRNHCHECLPNGQLVECRRNLTLQCTRRNRLKDLLAELYSRRDELPAVPGLVMTLLRRAPIANFGRTNSLGIYLPSGDVLNTVIEGAPKWVVEEQRRVAALLSRKIEIRVECVQLTDSNGVAISTGDLYHGLYAECWKLLYAEPVSVGRFPIGSTSAFRTWVAFFRTRIPSRQLALFKSKQASTLFGNVFVGIECKTSDQSSKILRFVKGPIENVWMEDLLDLAGYDLTDASSYPDSVKLFVLRECTLKFARREGLKVQPSFQGARLDRANASWQWWTTIGLG